MKNSISIKTIIAAALFIVFTGAFAPAASATDSIRVTPGVQLKFIGEANDKVVFEMNLVSAEAEVFTISIRDENGNLLYKEQVSGTNITRKFKMESDELEQGSLQVEVKTKNESKAQVFAINKNTRYVQETVITKVK
jgi:hypothetical protein